MACPLVIFAFRGNCHRIYGASRKIYNNRRDVLFVLIKKRQFPCPNCNNSFLSTPLKICRFIVGDVNKHIALDFSVCQQMPGKSGGCCEKAGGTLRKVSY